ncbi:NUDIX hydrolase [Candidatus Woesearchaeota archaeon]|nr:NUDIX hydrolase [Candidatus Woesearchaeota archaeon]MCF7901018.1 NUDIX hydrolase [Candidatus Woesearchaeota archaeon]MCF8013401.1 NUDIX hydrolase [Candidatus Woesearchaeota archaeon]
MNREYFDYNKKGHLPTKEDKVIFRPGVYVLVKNSENKYLFIIEKTVGKWEIPGGGIEPGETFHETGIRELKEETGFDIEIIDKTPVYIENDLAYYPKLNLFRHEHKFFFRGILKSNKKDNQNFAKDEEITQMDFFSREEIKNLDIAFWHKKALAKLLEE